MSPAWGALLAGYRQQVREELEHYREGAATTPVSAGELVHAVCLLHWWPPVHVCVSGRTRKRTVRPETPSDREVVNCCLYYSRERVVGALPLRLAAGARQLRTDGQQGPIFKGSQLMVLQLHWR